jgi:YVTN family beta-propeller protein
MLTKEGQSALPSPICTKLDTMFHLLFPFLRNILFSAAVVALLTSTPAAKAADDDDDGPKAKADILPSGQRITPQAIPGSEIQLFNPGLSGFPNFVANGGMTTVVSPDKKTLIALIAGYNSQNDSTGNTAPDASSQYLFVYDIANKKPVQKQVIKVANTYDGIAFDPTGKTFYVGGGVDDVIHSFGSQSDGSWAETGTAIKLGHTTTNSVTPTDVSPSTAGVAITADGTKLLVSNLYNDSVSIIDIASRSLLKEVDLRPGVIDPAKTGVPGGEYPDWIVIKGNDTAYISSLRDREIVVFDIASQTVASRIKIKGSPNRMILNKAQSRLFVTTDFQDQVHVIDTRSNRVI